MIAYETFAAPYSGDFNIYVAEADGSGARRLTDDPRWDVFPIWSEDGSEIYFLTRMDADTGVGSDYDIGVVSVEGGDARVLEAAPEDVGFRLSVVGGRAFFTSIPIGNEIVTVEVGALIDAAESGAGG